MRALPPLPARTALWSRLCLGIAPLAMLGACMTQDQAASSSGSGMGVATNEAGGSTAATASAARPGSVMTGASTASMAGQYPRSSVGAVATGASAWVPPAPPPAYVATGPAPTPDPPAPPPAAVANRQPSAPAARPSTPASRPAVAASEIVRPEAAQPESSAPEMQAQQASLSAAELAKGRQLFSDFSCGACHILADAGGSGSIGPALDRNPRLTPEFTAGVIHDGRGAMPAFAGQISDPDIATLAAYIVQVSRK